MHGWENFYVIVGAAGATLIGIQFIVITLIATMRYGETTPETIDAFGTPTVVHFAYALLVSAIMSAPWPSLAATSLAIAVCGVGAFGYAMIVIRRARRLALACHPADLHVRAAHRRRVPPSHGHRPVPRPVDDRHARSPCGVQDLTRRRVQAVVFLR